MKFRFGLKTCAAIALIAATYFAVIRGRVRLRREAISCQPLLRQQLSSSFTTQDLFLVDEFGRCELDSIKVAESDSCFRSLLGVGQVEEVEINHPSILATDIEGSPAVGSCEVLRVGTEVRLNRRWVQAIGRLANLRTLIIQNNRFEDLWFEELSGLENVELILLESKSITGQYLGAIHAPKLTKLIVNSQCLKNSFVAEGVGSLMQHRQRKVQVVLKGDGLSDEIFQRLGTREKLYFMGMPRITMEGVFLAQKRGLDVDRSRPSQLQ